MNVHDLLTEVEIPTIVNPNRLEEVGRRVRRSRRRKWLGSGALAVAAVALAAQPLAGLVRVVGSSIVVAGNPTSSASALTCRQPELARGVAGDGSPLSAEQRLRPHDLGRGWKLIGEPAANAETSSGPAGTDRAATANLALPAAKDNGAAWSLTQTLLRASPGQGAKVLEATAGPFLCDDGNLATTASIESNVSEGDKASVAMWVDNRDDNTVSLGVWRRQGDYVFELFLAWHPAGLPFVPGRDLQTPAGVERPNRALVGAWLGEVADIGMTKALGETAAAAPPFPPR